MTQQTANVVQPAHQRTQQEWEQVQDVAGIAYGSIGSGVPVLFLHGIGGAARQFQNQLAHFGQHYRALAWDAPGYGESVPLPLVSIDALAGALGMFIRTLGLDRPVIVGHSLGGMLALRLMAQAPHTARALVLSQTAAAFGGKDPAWADQFVHDRLAPLDAGHGMAELAQGMAAELVGPDADPAGVALAADCIAHTPDSTYRDTVLAMPGFDQRAALPGIIVPTLVLAGSLDRNAPPDGMERMAAKIPGARYKMLDGVGHLAHLEAPARFNAVLAEFLAGLPD